MNRVAIIVPQLTPGGTERTAAELANFLVQKGFEVSLLLMFKKEKFFAIDNNVMVIEPPDLRKKLGKLFYIPFLLLFIRREIKKTNPKIVFALGYILFSLIALVGIKTKVVISFRSSPDRVRFPNSKIGTFLYNKLHTILKLRVDGVIAQTNFAKKIYGERYNCPITVIPNFLREFKDYNLERKNQIITVGRLVFEKAQHYLIEAFALVNAPEWKLVIVGGGPKKADLQKLAKRLRVSDRLIFTGFQKDVDFFLAQSKIFVLTSIIEGFPNALIEGMANGLPPVSFNCNAGPSDIIEDGVNGFLVKEGDVAILAKRIQKLIDNPALLNTMAQKAKKAKEDYHISKIGEEYLNFIQSIVNN